MVELTHVAIVNSLVDVGLSGFLAGDEPHTGPRGEEEALEAGTFNGLCDCAPSLMLQLWSEL